MTTREELDVLIAGLVPRSWDELAATLGVTPSTVGRDLALLTEQGVIARTYGGAITTHRAPGPWTLVTVAGTGTTPERLAPFRALPTATVVTV